MSRAILDDHLLRDLLAADAPAGLVELLAAYEPATTNLYLYRLSKSVASARGGAHRRVERRAPPVARSEAADLA